MLTLRQATQEPHSPSINVLFAFASEMHAWELEMLLFHNRIAAGEITDDAAVLLHSTSMRQNLKEIFIAYCEAGASAKRPNDRLHWGGECPLYDPDCETVTSVTEKSGKVVIETQETRYAKFKYRYEMIDVGSGWKIRDNRKSSFAFETKWRSYNL